MKVLIAFEQSGTMRRAFNDRGHDAWSIDIAPAWDRSNRHIVGDVRDYLTPEWDLLAVMHPPCTRLCNSGVRWLSVPPPGRTRAEMWAELDEGAALFSAAWNAPIPRKAIENPVMHKHAKARIVNFRPATQTVQPWWFGDPAFKATGWYLDGLPPLVPTNRLTPPRPGTAEHRAWSKVHRASPGSRRAIERATSFPGMCAAAADQWGGYALKDIAA